MSDERTDEQRQADDELRVAIEHVAQAYAGEAAGWLLTEYVVIYAQQGWDSDGDAMTSVGMAVDGDTTPIHRLLGLCEYAAHRYRRLIWRSDDEED